MNKQIATFFLGETRLGIDILMVKEVYRHKSFTPIPDSPPHLRGLMNLRGRVVTVIDLNVCLNRPAAEDIEHCRLLILKTDEEIESYKQAGMLENISLGEDFVGLLIDRMDDVIDVDETEIFPPPSNLDEVEEDLIKGVVKLGGELVIILDVAAILDRILEVAKQGER